MSGMDLGHTEEKPGKVLVVDDDAGARGIIALLLQECRFTVETAANGAEAIAKLAGDRGSITAVVTDVSMPDMTGVELAYYIRERYPWLAVAIVSGDISDIERSIVTRAGVPFIKKPVTMEALTSAITEAKQRIGDALATDD